MLYSIGFGGRVLDTQAAVDAFIGQHRASHSSHFDISLQLITREEIKRFDSVAPCPPPVQRWGRTSGKKHGSPSNIHSHANEATSDDDASASRAACEWAIRALQEWVGRRAALAGRRQALYEFGEAMLDQDHDLDSIMGLFACGNRYPPHLSIHDVLHKLGSDMDSEATWTLTDFNGDRLQCDTDQEQKQSL